MIMRGSSHEGSGIGGTGRTGPHIVRSLVELGHDFKRLRPDVVVHMAAFTREDAQLFVGTFRDITGRCAVVSSADVYLAYGRLHGAEPGPAEPLPLTEAAPLRTKLGPEGEAYNKTAVEEILRDQSELSSTIIRYPAVWGPGDLQRRFSDYFRRIADGRQAILISNGDVSFRFSHAYCEDAAHAVVLAVTNETATGRIYNVAEYPTPTGLERLKTIATTLGWQGRFVVVPGDQLPQSLQRPPIHLEQHLVIDSSRIRTELGFNEIVADAEAIRRAYYWQIENPEPDARATDYEAEDVLLRRWS